MYSKRVFSLLIASLSTLACAHARLITADGPLALDPDEGILIIHVESDFPIRNLRFSSGTTAASNLAKGESIALAVLPAGDYRWAIIEVPVGNTEAYYRFRMRFNSDWTFKVEAGHITYPGAIIVKGSSYTLYSEGSLWTWTQNRSAMALERIRATYPVLLTQYPLASGRNERDDFLTYYQDVSSPASWGASEGSPN